MSRKRKRGNQDIDNYFLRDIEEEEDVTSKYEDQVLAAKPRKRQVLETLSDDESTSH